MWTEFTETSGSGISCSLWSVFRSQTWITPLWSPTISSAWKTSNPVCLRTCLGRKQTQTSYNNNEKSIPIYLTNMWTQVPATFESVCIVSPGWDAGRHSWLEHWPGISSDTGDFLTWGAVGIKVNFFDHKGNVFHASFAYLKSQMRAMQSSPPVYIQRPSSWKPTDVMFLLTPS